MNGPILFSLGLVSARVLLAQGLPPLQVGSPGNHEVVISWNYTNAGFALQEAMSLFPATNWQYSTLAPVFDSNRTIFAVCTPLTNTAKFFRLKQQADTLKFSPPM